MRKENQVCTLEQAIKLKQLCVSQVGYFEHVKKVGKDWSIRPKPYIDTQDLKEIYSAFTVSELGTMLGNNPALVQDILYAVSGKIEALKILDVKVLAGYVIEALEHGLITAGDANERLKAC